MRFAALLSLLLLPGCLEARAEDFASLPGAGAVGGVGGSGGLEDMAAGSGGDPPALFDFTPTDSGLSQLTSSITVNGTPATPFLEYLATDAIDGGNWTTSYGPTLEYEDRTGDGQSVGNPAPFTDTSRAVRVALGSGTGDSWQAASGPDSDITTGDLVFEWVSRVDAASPNEPILATYRDSGVVDGGFEIDANGRLLLADGTDLFVGPTATMTAGTWYHGMIFCNWGAWCTIYVNGVYVNDGDISAINTLTAGTAQPLTFGSRANFSGVFLAGDVAAVRVWVGATAWFTSSTQAAVAAERFARLTGVYADRAGGQAYPTVITRNTTATVDIDRDDDGVRRVFHVGASWPRVAKRNDSASTLQAGYLSERQSTNLALQSATFGTTWAKIDAGDTITNGTAAPDGSTDGDAVIADATDGQHGVTQAVIVTAATYTASVWAKAGSQGHAYLSDDTVANAYSYFDLSPCGVGTNGAGASNESAEDWGGGWCRLSISYTGTAASHTHRVGCAPADNDNTFSGDGAATACVLWGAQVENQPEASSYIATTSSTVTRNADDLRFTATSNATVATGTIESAMLLPSYAHPSVTSDLVWVGTAASGTNYVRQTVYADEVYSDLVSGGVNYFTRNTTVGNPTDGAHHTSRVVWTTNSAKAWYDGAQIGAEDTSVTVPANFATIFVGQDKDAASQADGLITRLRIWDSVAEP